MALPTFQPSVSPIPDDAEEVIVETYETGRKQKATYRLDGQEIGSRFWNPSGVLVMECTFNNGVRHGLCRTWHDNGQLEEYSTYYEGKEHGTSIQYDWDGTPIGSYTMNDGTGVDVWFAGPGVLSEEREYHDGKLHGYERWWAHDNETVYQERHFWNDVEHGIFREWNTQQKLRRGFPQYYIMGKRVNKRQYERACRNDPTLPPFNTEDNQPFRKLPKEALPYIDPNAVNVCILRTPVQQPIRITSDGSDGNA